MPLDLQQLAHNKMKQEEYIKKFVQDTSSQIYAHLIACSLAEHLHHDGPPNLISLIQRPEFIEHLQDLARFSVAAAPYLGEAHGMLVMYKKEDNNANPRPLSE